MAAAHAARASPLLEQLPLPSQLLAATGGEPQALIGWQDLWRQRCEIFRIALDHLPQSGMPPYSARTAARS